MTVWPGFVTSDVASIKNTMFIHPDYGSFLLLGTILTNQDLVVDDKQPVNPAVRSSEVGGCGTCRRCQVYCPTGALDEDYASLKEAKVKLNLEFPHVFVAGRNHDLGDGIFMGQDVFEVLNKVVEVSYE